MAAQDRGPHPWLVIRVAVVDDHQAVRMGLRALLRSEPDVVPVGTAEHAGEVAPLVLRTDPDVVLLDYRLGDSDGLTVCRHLKSRADAPAVLLYTAFADGALIVPAIVAGADGLLDKGGPAPELLDAVRLVARGDKAFPPVSSEQLNGVAQALDPDDLPILGMLVGGTATREIAEALRLTDADLDCRLGRMLQALQSHAASTGLGAG